VGTQSVVLFAQDSSGNVDSATAFVTVLDTVLPTIVCQEDTTVCVGNIYFNPPVYFDNCSSTIIQTSGPNSGDLLQEGQYFVEYQVTDSSGNQSSCTRSIVVLPKFDAGKIIGPHIVWENGVFSYFVDATNGSTYQWNANGGLVQSSNQNIAQIQWFSGPLNQIVLYVENSIGCIDTLYFEVEKWVLSTTNIHKELEWKMYPNPAIDALKFEFIDFNNHDIEIALFDILGKEVYKQKVFRHQLSQTIELNLHQLNRGVYIVKVYSDNWSDSKRLILY